MAIERNTKQGGAAGLICMFQCEDLSVLGHGGFSADPAVRSVCAERSRVGRRHRGKKPRTVCDRRCHPTPACSVLSSDTNRLLKDRTEPNRILPPTPRRSVRKRSGLCADANAVEIMTNHRWYLWDVTICGSGQGHSPTE